MTRPRPVPPPASAAALRRGRRRLRLDPAAACLVAAFLWASPVAAEGIEGRAVRDRGTESNLVAVQAPVSEAAAGEVAAEAPEGGEPGVETPAARRFRLADPASGRSPWAPHEWALSAGVFDLAKTERAEAGLELRFAPRLVRLFDRDWTLEPALGGMANEDGGYYGYLGLRLPIELGSRWRATPSFGAGIYSAGDGIDLGGPVEFRSGIEVSARLGERTSLGVTYYHLSNGILYDLNPGQESLVLVLALRPGAVR